VAVAHAPEGVPLSGAVAETEKLGELVPVALKHKVAEGRGEREEETVMEGEREARALAESLRDVVPLPLPEALRAARAEAECEPLEEADRLRPPVTEPEEDKDTEWETLPVTLTDLLAKGEREGEPLTLPERKKELEGEMLRDAEGQGVEVLVAPRRHVGEEDTDSELMSELVWPGVGEESREGRREGEG
jgi:hypothetical protein